MKNGNPPIFEKMFGSDMARVVANDPFELARRNADAIRGKTAIRIAVGGADSLLPRNRAMHETLEELKIDHEFEVVRESSTRRQNFMKRSASGPSGTTGKRWSLRAIGSNEPAQAPRAYFPV